MPLYKIPPRADRPLGFHALNYTEQEMKHISFEIRTNFRRQTKYKKILPALYVGKKVLFIIIESDDFELYTQTGVSPNKIGRFDGMPVYTSELLSSDEYFIGIEEREILQYLRGRKLNKIISKM